ncbi:MAG: hypothetical protein R3B51_12095 [Thermodesulfobacteriota bacterium]
MRIVTLSSLTSASPPSTESFCSEEPLFILYLAFREKRDERNVPGKDSEFSQNPRRDDFVDYFVHYDPRWGYNLKL